MCPAGNRSTRSGPDCGLVADLVAGLVHPQLQHAAARGPVANDGVGHDVPAKCLRNEVGAEFPTGQRAVREIPQRRLAGDRLVHAMRLALTEMRLAEEGGVAR